MPGRQDQQQSRVGASEFRKASATTSSSPGWVEAARKTGLASRGDRLAALQQPLKFPDARLIPVLEQTVIFQVAGEVQSVRGYPQLLQALIILGGAGGDQVIFTY